MLWKEERQICGEMTAEFRNYEAMILHNALPHKIVRNNGCSPAALLIMLSTYCQLSAPATYHVGLLAHELRPSTSHSWRRNSIGATRCAFKNFITYRTSQSTRPQWFSGHHTRHWIRRSRVQTRPGWMDFSEHKNPQYDFLRKGSKAIGPDTQNNIKPKLEPLSKICQAFHDQWRKWSWWHEMLKSAVKPNYNNFTVGGDGIRASIFNRCTKAIVRTREVPLVHASCDVISLSRTRSCINNFPK